MSLGLIHLSEASAQAVELIQRRLENESGPKASVDNLFSSSLNKGDAAPANAVPYYLANWLYTAALQAVPTAADRGCLEEFYVIVDLAMMLDPVILEHRKGEEDFTPMHAFIQLLGVYCDACTDLPRLSVGWRQADVVLLQNELLKAARIDQDMASLTERAQEFAEEAFAHCEDSSGLPPDLLGLYRTCYRKMLDVRRRACKGGAILEDFFVGQERLYDFILGVVPAFSIGDSILSPGGCFQRGWGWGVQIQNFFVLKDLLEAFLFGNKPCPLHTAQPRLCPGEEHALCRKIPRCYSGRNRCVREEMLAMLAEHLGIREIQWDEAGQRE